MASAGTRPAAAALLFSFSAVVFLFYLLLHQAPVAPGLAVADHLASALDRFLDGRGLMELATRRNMILLCHAILFLILRDAGVLGAPASRRSRSPLGEATAAWAPPHATRSAVVAPIHVHEHDATGRVDVECRPAVEAVATWTAPLLTTGSPAQAVEEAAAAATKQIVLVESPTPRNDDDDDDDDQLDRHDRAAVVGPLEHPKAIAADGERDDDSYDHRIIAVGNDDKLVDMAREQQTAEMEMELADDRTFEEFIESQRRQMRQESLQLLRSGYQVTITRR